MELATEEGGEERPLVGLIRWISGGGDWRGGSPYYNGNLISKEHVNSNEFGKAQ